MKPALGSLKKRIFLYVKVFFNIIYVCIITILCAGGIMTVAEGLTERNIWKIVYGIVLCASAITSIVAKVIKIEF